MKSGEPTAESEDTLLTCIRGPTELPVTTCETASASREATETRGQVLERTADRLYEPSAPQVSVDPSLLRATGYVTLRRVDAPVRAAPPVQVSTVQRLVRG